MSMRLFICLAIAACAIVLPPAEAGAQPGQARGDAPAPKRGYVTASGVSYYYEIHGRGEPLLLLHGGLGQIEMFGPVLPLLAKERQVIAVDLYGHGRTALTDRPIDIPDMGNDIAIVLRQLGFSQVDALGYSLGGNVAFRLAVQHPALVRRLVIASAGFSTDGFHPEMRPMQAAVSAAMAGAMTETPMYKGYVAVAPRPQDFPLLLDRIGDLMRRSFDWSADVPALRMPVMLVFGDADMFRLDHVTRFYNLLGGGLKDAGWAREHMSRNRLAILPDLTHYEMFMSPRLVETVLPFLNGLSNPPSWANQGRN